MAKTTVALTPDADEVLGRLLDLFNLPEKADVVRLGFAYAVSRGLDPVRPDDFGVPGSTGNYTANTGTLDPGGKIANLVVAVYGDLGEPYHAVETLASKGMLAIFQGIESGEIGSLSDLLPKVDALSG